jgi:hypothetical protein
VFVGFFIVVAVVVLLGILRFISSLEVFDFLSGLLAGIFGILIGFSLDRVSETRKDNQTKNDFLNLIREELVETKNSIYPQKEGVYVLYTGIWDSVISSGVVRLLSTEQVSKLSRVYKAIKSASYEAEWIGRNSEELDILHFDKAHPRAAVTEKLAANLTHHNRRLENMGKMIDELLKEDWWTKTG